MHNTVFFQWFTNNLLVGGDWRFFWPQNIQELLTYSYAWDTSLNTGLGQSNLGMLWLHSYISFVGYFYTHILHIPWSIAEKLLFFWPILIISIVSSFFLSRYIYKNTIVNVFSSVIYIVNTYALMMFDGGQVGVALGYAVAPAVFHFFIRLTEMRTLRNALLLGLIVAVQLLFDPRIVFVTYLGIFLYTLFYYFYKRQIWKNVLSEIVLFFIIPFIIVLGLHLFWIVPTIMFVQSPIESQGSGYTSAEAFKFFSFATFSNALSLLHPYWPENIFGKVSFMKPEFLLLPLLAFSFLFGLSKASVKKTINQKLLCFAVIALVAVFLAKGANEPLGQINIWMFEHIPGMILFRDATKFYTLIAITYAVLIPIGVVEIIQRIEQTKLGKSFKKIHISSLIIGGFLLYTLYLIHPALFGNLHGTFQEHAVPTEYEQLSEYVQGQNKFFRTMWVPQTQRFSYFSNTHPMLSAIHFYPIKKQEDIYAYLRQPEQQRKLQEAAVKYVIVPYDSQGEIFLIDRKYDEKQYKKTIEALDTIDWLQKKKHFGKIVVYELPGVKDHFFLQDGSQATVRKIQFINPTEYVVTVENVKKGDILVFSEQYNSFWQARVGENLIISAPYGKLLNSFTLPKDGTYTVRISYIPQAAVQIGRIASIGILFLVIVLVLKKK